MYSSGNKEVRNWVHLFESRCTMMYGSMNIKFTARITSLITKACCQLEIDSGQHYYIIKRPLVSLSSFPLFKHSFNHRNVGIKFVCCSVPSQIEASIKLQLMECRYSSLAFSCFIPLVYAFSIRERVSIYWRLPLSFHYIVTWFKSRYM